MPEDILILMTDQHRADWIGAYGATWVRTPTLDSLAAEGIIFTECITASPVSMPARVSFLSGMYPHNHGMWNNAGRLCDTAETYLHPLRAAGYRTAHIGKSHLHPHGGGRDLRDSEPYMHSLGWDDVFECTGPLSTQTTYSILTDWMQAEGTYDIFLEDYRKRAALGARALWPSPLPEGKHPDDFMAQTAIGYIERSNPTQPLFLFVGLGGPHNPFDPPARFDRYNPEDMPPPLPPDPAPEWLSGPALEHHDKMMRHNRDVSPEEWARMRSLYSARVEHVDYLMGKVLDAWWHVRGRNTWVLFWSDHGEMLGDKSRCAKGVFYRASVRIPAILRPPEGTRSAPLLSSPGAKQGSGRRCDSVVSLVDLTATVLDIAGCTPSPNVFGTSLLSALHDGALGVSEGLAVSEIKDRTMVYDGRWKMVLNSRNELLKLFDTREDPEERVNLAGRKDVEDVVEHLRRELLAFLLRTAHRQYRDENA